MDSEYIEQLLEKYWKAETTLEEEQQLRDHFREGTIPDKWKGTASLFHFLDTEKNKSLQDNFEKTVTKEMLHRQGGKVISMVKLANIARIAAGLLVVVVATYFIRQEVRKSYPQELQDTYSDPKMALEETKKALMMISNSFNKAQRDAGKIKAFNEAEEKIQNKSQKEKRTI